MMLQGSSEEIRLLRNWTEIHRDICLAPVGEPLPPAKEHKQSAPQRGRTGECQGLYSQILGESKVISEYKRF